MNITPILEVRNVVKRYPGVTAVDNISFSILPSICFGLLGPNGAGKTTTIEIIEGILSPTEGSVLFKGSARTASFHEDVGIQFQSTSLLQFLTVRETLETFQKLYKKSIPLDEVISLCYLEDILTRKNDKISGGQKQRLLLALALINDPDLIFLDEPTTGLDPQARRHAWDIISSIKKRGKTVVLTTHYMEEAQMLCDEIAIIDMGKIILRGSPEELINEHCSGATISIPNTSSKLREIISTDGLTLGTIKMDGEKRYEFYTNDVNNSLKLLVEKGLDVSGITIRSQNLEDLFIQMTGRRLRE